MTEVAGQSLSEEELAELGVRCLTLDLHEVKLLLPNTLVAEVTDAIDIAPVANTPEWLRGFISWRGRNVPLVSFEQLLGKGEDGRHDERRMVILNTLNGNPQIPFIAAEIQGLPRLSLLKHGMLEYDDNENSNEPVVLTGMRVEGEAVLVPNLDTVEKMLKSLGISWG